MLHPLAGNLENFVLLHDLISGTFSLRLQVVLVVNKNVC